MVAAGVTYEEQREALIQYLKAKLAIEDWHAIRDVAADIELLDARNQRHADGCKNGTTTQRHRAVVCGD